MLPATARRSDPVEADDTGGATVTPPDGSGTPVDGGLYDVLRPHPPPYRCRLRRRRTVPAMDIRVAVIGAGSWGTTVAALAARNTPTVIWSRRADLAAQINDDHRNGDYLADYELPHALEATDDLERGRHEPRRAGHGGAVGRVPRRPGGGGQAPAPVGARHQPHQGPRDRHPQAHERDRHRGRARAPRGRPDRAQPGQGDPRRPRRRHRDRHGRPQRRRGPGRAVPGRAVPRLHQRGRDRLRARRRAQERHRHRRRAWPTGSGPATTRGPR